MTLRSFLGVAVVSVAACERSEPVGRTHDALVTVYGPAPGNFGRSVAGFRGGYLVGDPNSGLVYRETLQPVPLPGGGQFASAFDCLVDGGCTFQNGSTGTVFSPFGNAAGRIQPAHALAAFQLSTDQLAVAVGFPDNCSQPPCPGLVELHRAVLGVGTATASFAGVVDAGGFGTDVAFGFVQGAAAALLGVTSVRGPPRVFNLGSTGLPELRVPQTVTGSSIRFGVFDFGSGIMVGDPATSRAIGLRLDGGVDAGFSIAKVIACGDSGVGLELAVFDFDGDSKSDVVLSRPGAVAVALSSNSYACEPLQGPAKPGETEFGAALSSYESLAGPRLLVGSPLAVGLAGVTTGAVHVFEHCDLPSQLGSPSCPTTAIDAGRVFDGGFDAGGSMDASMLFDAGTGPDAGVSDAGPIADAGSSDAGANLDAGSSADAGSSDAGANVDAGSIDAGVNVDAGPMPDAGVSDAGLTRDGGTSDAGAEDGGLEDAGSSDGGRARAFVFVPACSASGSGWPFLPIALLAIWRTMRRG